MPCSSCSCRPHTASRAEAAVFVWQQAGPYPRTPTWPLTLAHHVDVLCREKRAEAKRKGRRLGSDESDSDYDDAAGRGSGGWGGVCTGAGG